MRWKYVGEALRVPSESQDPNAGELHHTGDHGFFGSGLNPEPERSSKGPDLQLSKDETDPPGVSYPPGMPVSW